jgi:hypothetical protein
MWYSWPDEQSFDAWHTAACNALGIPHPGYNEATGELDPDAQWTTAYTQPIKVSPTDWRAIVEPAVAVTCPNGLGAPCDPPPSPDPEVTP